MWKHQILPWGRVRIQRAGLDHCLCNLRRFPLFCFVCCHITSFGIPRNIRCHCSASFVPRRHRCTLLHSIFGYGWLGYFACSSPVMLLMVFMYCLVVCFMMCMCVLWCKKMKDWRANRQRANWNHWQAYPLKQQQPGFAQPFQINDL